MQPATLIDSSVSPSQDVMQRFPVAIKVKNAFPVEAALPVVSFAAPISDVQNIAPGQNKEASRPKMTERMMSALFIAANDILSPLSIHEDGKFVRPGMSFVLCLGLSGFIVWGAYFAVPTLPQTLPLTSLAGAGYMTLLIPSSLMASCLALSAGRLIGKWSGKAFSAVLGGGSTHKKPDDESLSSSKNTA